MDVVMRTLVHCAGPDGLVRRRVEVPPGSRVEAAAGPGGELWYVIDGTGLLTSGDDPAAPIRRDRSPRCGCRRARGTGWPPAPRASSRWTASRCPPDRPLTAARRPVAQPRRSELGDCPVEVTGTGGSGSCSGRATGARQPPSSWVRFRPAAPRGTATPTGRGRAWYWRARRVARRGRRAPHLPGHLHPPAARAAALPGEHRTGHAAGARRVPPGRQSRRQDQRVLSSAPRGARTRIPGSGPSSRGCNYPVQRGLTCTRPAASAMGAPGR